jgi:DNA helicase-2/ATP-dependent DNA helicase PcrA
MKWTGEQKDIHFEFACGKRNVIIEATAGSGKTTTVQEGIDKAREAKILYAVFGKKNQLEAKIKIKNPNATILTLHSLGFSFISKNWGKVKAGASTEFFRIKEICPDMPAMAMFRTAQLVSYLKNTLINPTVEDAIKIADLRGIDAGKDDAAWPVKSLAEIAIKSIEKSKNYSFNISFDDMVFLPNSLGLVKKQFDLVIIDEAQDMSLPQLTMAINSCNDGGRIIIVGNCRQAIYGFRGALSDGMTRFKDKLNAKELTLSTSFRCPRKIIELAKVIAPEITAAENAIEGELNNINEDSFYSKVKVGDTILSRTNSAMMPVCLNLIKKNISAFICGRDIGKMLIDLVKDLGGKNVIEFLDNLQKWQDIQTLKLAGKTYAGNALATVQDKAETLRVLSDSCLTVQDLETKLNNLFQDAEDVRKPSIELSSIHRYKGRENDNIFLLEDSFKGRKGLTAEETKEESNIRFVAITRSKKTLNLVSLNNGGKPPKKTNLVNPIPKISIDSPK